MSSVQNNTSYSSQNNSAVLDENEYDDNESDMVEQSSLADQSQSHYSSDALPRDNSVDGTFDGSRTSQLDNDSMNTSRQTDYDSRDISNTSAQRNRPSQRLEQKAEPRTYELSQNRLTENEIRTRPSSITAMGGGGGNASTPISRTRNNSIGASESNTATIAKNNTNAVSDRMRNANLHNRRDLEHDNQYNETTGGANRVNVRRREMRTPSRESSINGQTINSTLNYTVTSYNSPSSRRTPSYMDEERTLGESQEYYEDEYDYSHTDLTQDDQEVTNDGVNHDESRDGVNINRALINRPRKLPQQRERQPQEQSETLLNETPYDGEEEEYYYEEEEEQSELESSGYGSLTYEDSALRSPRSASERSATFASFYFANPTVQRFWEQVYFFRRPIYFLVCATTGNTFISLLSTLMRSVSKQIQPYDVLSNKALDPLRYPSDNVESIAEHPLQVVENILKNNNNNETTAVPAVTTITPTTTALPLPSGYPNVPEWLRDIRASLPAIVEKPVSWCLRKSNIPVLSELQQMQLENFIKEQQQQQERLLEHANTSSKAGIAVSTLPIEQTNNINAIFNSKTYNKDSAVVNAASTNNNNNNNIDSALNATAETGAIVPAALFLPILSLMVLIIAKCIIARQNYDNSILQEQENVDYDEEEMNEFSTTNYMTSLDNKMDSDHIIDNSNSNSNTDSSNRAAESTASRANVMNDYLQAHVVTNAINNTESTEMEGGAVSTTEEANLINEEERQISEGENVSEGMVNVANNANEGKLLVTNPIAIDDNNNIMTYDNENLILHANTESNINTSINNSSSNNEHNVPERRVRSSPSTSPPLTETLVTSSVLPSHTDIKQIIENHHPHNAEQEEMIIPRPQSSRFALKGDVVVALIGNPTINEINVLLVAATRYECRRVFLSHSVQTLPHMVHTPHWLDVQFVDNVLHTVSETALLHGLRRVGIFAEPAKDHNRGTAHELIPLPRFRHPVNALYVFIATSSLALSSAATHNSVSEYDKLAQTVRINTESHVYSGPAHGEAGIPVNECFYDRLQKERQAERAQITTSNNNNTITTNNNNIAAVV